MINLDFVRIFVNGNVQNRFVLLAERLEQFIAEIAPIIERVNLSVDRFKGMTMEKVTSNEIEVSYRSDATNAKAGLSAYNRMFGQIDHHLAMASSNFGLPKFLEENGVPKALINEYQSCIHQYWDETYGLIGNKFRKILPILKDMRSTLSREVFLLEAQQKVLYFRGFDPARELHELFKKERELFYKLVGEWRSSDFSDEFTHVESICNVYLAKAKEWAKNVMRQTQSLVKEDFTSHQEKGQRILLVLMYSLGAANTLLNLNLKKKAASAGIKYLIGKIGGLKEYMEQKGVITKFEGAQRAAQALVAERTQDAMANGLTRAAQELLRIVA
ncbi:MAG TPA: hypothetical protein VJG90_08300 [Candidatus Nanoarchaeia archaeon]|nr:hypothetical protein [Candidatus Nanoarchaeia archaeon]